MRLEELLMIQNHLKEIKQFIGSLNQQLQAVGLDLIKKVC